MADTILYPKGPIHLADLTAGKLRWEPMRTNHFEVIINDLPVELALAVNTFSLPNVTNEALEISHGNSKVKYAGPATFEGADSLEVIDYVGLDTEKIVLDWRRKVYNTKTDGLGLAADYKKDGRVYEYAPNYSTIRTWRLLGMWPSGVAFGDTLTQEGGEVKKITLTMVYDRGYRDDEPEA